MAIKIIQYFKDAQNVQAMKGEMGKMMVKTQHLIDILSATDDEDTTGSYKGNEYQTYNKAITQIDKKYNGTAKWGVLQTRNIIDLRAAFIIARGIKISAKEKGTVKKEAVDATKELQWTKDFLEYNDLDKEMVQVFAVEAEIEGKILMKLDMDDTPKLEKYKPYGFQMPVVRYVSWLTKKYKVIPDEDDYKKYIAVTWQSKGQDEVRLEEPQFVYKKFGGRINDANQARSKVMNCLTQIDNLDKALRDWREINRIFGGPILYALCKDDQEVTKALEMFDNKNFKIKRMLAGTADLQFIILDIAGVASIEKEILTTAKMISGTTGVSVQYLGFIDLLKNRSTGDDQREALSSATVKDRATWEGAYEELIAKAMNLFNETVFKQKEAKGLKLTPGLIKVTIPVITQQHWSNIKDIWLPATIAGKVTQELFLEQLPDVDVQEELERQGQNEEAELERIKKENEDLKNEDNDPPFIGDEG